MADKGIQSLGRTHSSLAFEKELATIIRLPGSALGDLFAVQQWVPAPHSCALCPRWPCGAIPFICPLFVLSQLCHTADSF